mmetsp:Transcript_5959/g.15685  ORF Transcript_5959/g.15685 Transcript_5959/m.15685 type:complete len:205 (-) Transcript_5959:173-787(-)
MLGPARSMDPGPCAGGHHNSRSALPLQNFQAQRVVRVARFATHTSGRAYNSSLPTAEPPSSVSPGRPACDCLRKSTMPCSVIVACGKRRCRLTLSSSGRRISKKTRRGVSRREWTPYRLNIAFSLTSIPRAMNCMTMISPRMKRAAAARTIPASSTCGALRKRRAWSLTKLSAPARLPQYGSWSKSIRSGSRWLSAQVHVASSS